MASRKSVDRVPLRRRIPETTQKPLHRLNVLMVDAALDSLGEVDLVAVVVDASEPSGGGDRFLLDLVKRSQTPRILVLNKVDAIDKPQLLVVARPGGSNVEDLLAPLLNAPASGAATPAMIVEVRGGGRAGEEVGRDGEVAGAGEGVGEAGGGVLVLLAAGSASREGGIQLVLRELDAEDVG